MYPKAILTKIGIQILVYWLIWHQYFTLILVSWLNLVSTSCWLLIPQKIGNALPRLRRGIAGVLKDGKSLGTQWISTAPCLFQWENNVGFSCCNVCFLYQNADHKTHDKLFDAILFFVVNFLWCYIYIEIRTQPTCTLGGRGWQSKSFAAGVIRVVGQDESSPPGKVWSFWFVLSICWRMHGAGPFACIKCANWQNTTW